MIHRVNVTAESVHWVASYIQSRVNACITECSRHFRHLIQFFYFNIIYFFDKMVQVLHVFSVSLYILKNMYQKKYWRLNLILTFSEKGNIVFLLDLWFGFLRFFRKSMQEFMP